VTHNRLPRGKTRFLMVTMRRARKPQPFSLPSRAGSLDLEVSEVFLMREETTARRRICEIQRNLAADHGKRAVAHQAMRWHGMLFFDTNQE
jgi:hypothetical protein